MRFWAAILSIALVSPAFGHDAWGNGEPVPPWVKALCCGPEDVHNIPPEHVHLMADGYHIDEIETVIPVERALPSPDGEYWGFWRPALEPTPVIFCFFAPIKGS